MAYVHGVLYARAHVGRPEDNSVKLVVSSSPSWFGDACEALGLCCKSLTY